MSHGFTDEPLAGRRRLFIDLAVISGHDAGTGIQRVVRGLALALREEAATDWDIHFVSASRKRCYHDFIWPDRISGINTREMRAQPGDIFLGLDYSLDAIRRHRYQLDKFQRAGGILWFLVHDLLPLQHPEWFSCNTVTRYRAWFDIIAELADGFFCNSRQTEEELRKALAGIYGISTDYRVHIIPMGHAILEAPHDPDRRGGGDAVFVPRFDMSEPFALMVGTLEPRKGHRDVVEAFDALWRQGRRDRLVLVGRLGWQVNALRDHILGHPEYGAKLLWFQDVGDAELFGIYAASTGVIVASYAEGFGLPLIEALGHRKPVLARNLPVFRMHEGRGVDFFPATATVEELAATVRRWLDAARRGQIRVTLPTETWRDSARTLLAALRPGEANDKNLGKI